MLFLAVFGVPFCLLYIYLVNLPISLLVGTDMNPQVMPWNSNPAMAVGFSTAILLLM